VELMYSFERSHNVLEELFIDKKWLKSVIKKKGVAKSENVKFENKDNIVTEFTKGRVLENCTI